MQRTLHLYGTFNGIHSVVFEIFGRTENNEYTVTQELDYRTAVLLYDGNHSCKIVIENSDEFFRRKLCTERGKASEITHHDGNVLCLAAALLPFRSGKSIVGNIR